MSLVRIVSRILAAEVVLLVAATWWFVGPDRLRTARSTLRGRLRVAAPYLGALLVTLGVDKVARDVGPELSWVIGVNVTDRIFALEGAFVSNVQHLATPLLTAYFAAVYLAGYVFLLVFPLVAYFLVDDPLPFKRTTIAYVANYVVGLVCYVLFIAYGPRNLIPDAVHPLLYSTYPSAQLLTSQVNTNTNVFPSLHTSLSTTVLVLAYGTREQYPGWFLLVVPLSVSVAISTMYLGIHWGTDVTAGVLLGVGSVAIADRVLRRLDADESRGWDA